MRVIEVNKPIAEMVRGSKEYEQDAVRRAFYAQATRDIREPAFAKYSILDTFDAYVIVSEFGLDEPDEFYRIPYTRDGEGKITFAPESEWEPVELAYAPKPEPPEAKPEEPQDAPDSGDMGPGLGMMGGGMMGDSQTPAQPQAEAVAPRTPLKGGKKLDEDHAGTLQLLESTSGPKRIKAIGITAGVVNGNRRRYAADVLRAAVAELATHLHESAGQGRAIYLLGEAEHPEAKARRPSLREVVVKWDAARFNEVTQQVELDGHLIETEAGRDIQALISGGVLPGVSQRARGRSRFVDEAGERIEEVTELAITGYDLVMEPSDPVAGVTFAEDHTEDDDMTLTPEQLAEMLRAQPELVTGIVAEHVKALADAQTQAAVSEATEKVIAEQTAAAEAARAEAQAAQTELAEIKRQQAVAAAIAEQTKDLPYGAARNQLFVEAVRSANPATAEDVTALVNAKRQEYDAVLAAEKLRGMGMDIQVVGPVIEQATDGNWPEYARVAHAFTESLQRAGKVQPWQPKSPRNRNEVVAAQMLEHFDKKFRNELTREAKAFDEAETAAGLNLPYGVSRAILGAVWPTLVATGLFDVAPLDQAPAYIYYESYADETSKHVAITREEVTTDRNDWVSLAHKRLQPGTVVVENHANNVTYTEGTDYIIDYTNGKIMELATIGDATNCHVSYHYDSLREGEGAAIQSGKMTLDRVLLEVAADRLATQINDEAIVFSRSQLGYDAVNRTLMSLVNEVRRRIDADLMFDALSAAMGVSSNSGGTWTSATDPIIDFVSYLGVAKDKIAKRYYEPTGILMSSTRADAVANWDGFTAAGKRPDADLNVNGYIGRLKGLPVFASTEFSDAAALVFNREHLFHRVYNPMVLKGPFQSYSSGNLVAAQQWYVEEYNGTVVPVRSKAAYVAIA